MSAARLAVAAALIAAAALWPSGSLRAQQPAPAPCPAAIRAALDFWVGDWIVTVDGRRAGTDGVERVSKGAAIVERWTDTEGGEGTSLFSFDPFACTWHQLWITDAPDRVGGLKHKDLVALVPGASVRFQGAYPGRSAVTVLDRTTLTKLANGTVRQLIEVSADGGASWHGTFDAIYSRR
jgi:hypothetical protein